MLCDFDEDGVWTVGLLAPAAPPPAPAACHGKKAAWVREGLGGPVRLGLGAVGVAVLQAREELGGSILLAVGCR